ncbi:DUF3347 domain-containing protein [Anditalea andensis]|uniref:DUF3347 domain-containing protein n=1 Tax=Anditalea andensis TaxID=1048983 RepID=A0A074KW35_9BACT|nr:DUF3347 domain-containing protein [Anditalea andensis]KEO72465.1 hypothetical protein EL17_17145 [Anditalea andensis]
MRNLMIAFALTFAVACNNQTETQEETAHDDGSTHVMEADTRTAMSTDPDFTIESAAHQQLLRDFYTAYINLKEGLVAADNQRTDRAAKEMRTIITDASFNELEGEAHDHIAQMGRDVIRMVEHSDVEEQRNYLNSLSTSLFTMLKAGDIQTEAYLQHCPMAFDNQGAYWVSDKEEIRNPYYGDRMLKCGSVRETL